MASVIVPWPEIIATGSDSSIFRISASVSRPFIPGILMSSTTMSGGSRLTCAMPSGPGRGADELVVLVFEDHPQRVADGGLVVDDEDAGFHVALQLGCIRS